MEGATNAADEQAIEKSAESWRISDNDVIVGILFVPNIIRQTTIGPTSSSITARQ